MGTCAVGHAYNRGEVWYLPDVDERGGFDAALQWCGLTPGEIDSQITRRCFYAAPLFAKDKNSGQPEVVAILAIDADVPACLPDDAEEHVARVEPAIVTALEVLGQSTLIGSRPPSLATAAERTGSLPPKSSTSTQP